MSSWKLIALFTLALCTASALSWTPAPAHSQAPSPQPPGQSLQVVSSTNATGSQQIVIVDSERRAIAVYHVDPRQGRLSLKSSRQIDWDLQMEHFNGESPLPSELRSLKP
ncbi:MAG: hypothetical protein VXZ82_22730 [Planctomycetota bacterium]|nr:hypothetical protein [Planctomycetota bacterium]